MVTLTRHLALSAWTAVTVLSVSAGADYEGASGYGASTSTDELEVSHDGYPRGDQAAGGQSQAATEAPNYVVIEVEEGVSREVEGETVIVVQEPDPIAATDVAPPAPREVAVEQPVMRCPGGIWVDGYWTYGDGQYVWIDGHCVVERVNYVFVHPRWDFYANVWWFVPGYYRPCGVWVGFGYYRPYHWFPPYYSPYYRGYRGVPVHRGVPRHPTVARPVSRPTVRGVVPTNRVPTVGRQAPDSYGRAATVNRLPSRTPTVNRRPPTRTSSVTRLPPTRTSSVTRLPPTRAPSVNRMPPTRTSSVPRARPGMVSQPRVNPTPGASGTRGPAPRRPSAGARVGGIGNRVSASPSRTGTVRSPSVGRPSSPGVFGRSGMNPSRPSMGSRPSFGRAGGFSRPSSPGFGGARSVPTARAR